jgi:hypothetical protein
MIVMAFRFVRQVLHVHSLKNRKTSLPWGVSRVGKAFRRCSFSDMKTRSEACILQSKATTT